LSSPLLEVRGLSKKYCRDLKRSFFYGLGDLARQATGLTRGRGKALRRQEFWALEDVSFKLERGESLGIVGPNGAGKTTLLKILAGLIKPDRGDVIVRGRIVPLFARGAGFSKILSGHENIALNLLLLGLSPQEVEERSQAILDFAEIPTDALAAPLKTYSSGMSARLGFACAVYSYPDLLLVDESLGVGDLRFRAKCLRWLNEKRKDGLSVVMVSHSMGNILHNTERGLYMKRGRIVANDSTAAITALYEEDQLFSSHFTETSSHASESLCVSGADNVRCTNVTTGKTMRVWIALPTEIGERVELTIEEIPRRLGVVFQASYPIPSGPSTKLGIEFPELGLVGGVYRLRARIVGKTGTVAEHSTGLRVISSAMLSQNIFYQPSRWISAIETKPASESPNFVRELSSERQPLGNLHISSLEQNR